MALEETVKEQIREWAKEEKNRRWLVKNIKKLEEIYCNKPVVIEDTQGMILEPVKRIDFDEKGFLVIQGKRYATFLDISMCSFDAKDYSITFKEFGRYLGEKVCVITFKEYLSGEFKKHYSNKKWLLEENKKDILKG